jgi:V/A-type H+-transporting ATPase subunit D
VKEAAVRSRLIQLRHDLAAARSGRDLLDRKREAILRALAERLPREAVARDIAAIAIAHARAAVDLAQTEAGRAALEAASLAQPPVEPPAFRHISVVGVAVPMLIGQPTGYRPFYGPASGPPSFDRAGAAFTAALPAIYSLASEETGVRRLRAALRRTARRMNALDEIVLPRLERQIAEVGAALEEEERDEAIRRKRWVAGRRPGPQAGSS